MQHERTDDMAKASSSNGGGQKPRPVHVVRFGGIKAAVWLNQTSAGPIHNVTVSRSYKDAEDNWQETGSFGYDDLLVLAKALDDAHSWIHEARSKAAETQQG